MEELTAKQNYLYPCAVCTVSAQSNDVWLSQITICCWINGHSDAALATQLSLCWCSNNTVVLRLFSATYKVPWLLAQWLWMSLHSCILSRKDLVQGHGRSPEYSSLDSLLMGERQHNNIRAMAEVHCSSVEEQVACLIDLATDANILGRTWQGWDPWVWVNPELCGCRHVYTSVWC